MKVAFYKCEGNIVDKLIRWWTKSEYSHVELIIGDYWYSISPRDTYVRKKIIDYKEDHWDIIDIDARYSPGYALLFYEKIKGSKYDWAGILLSQVLPLNVHDRKRWFCSEFVAATLKIDNPNRYSPEDLYKFITEGTVK